VTARPAAYTLCEWRGHRSAAELYRNHALVTQELFGLTRFPLQMVASANGIDHLDNAQSDLSQQRYVDL